MMVKTALKENLPWIVPSVAIVLAAMGFFDRSSETPAPLTSIVTDTSVQTSAAALATATPGPEAETTASQDVRSEEALIQALQQKEQDAATVEPEPVTIATAAAAQPKPTVALDPASASAASLQAVALQAAQVQPNRVQVPQPEQKVSLPSTSDDPAAFFRAAQANLTTAKSCVNDLRNLADLTRVYFPSGGLTGAAEGIAQARTLGQVAQECPGIMIQVEGHSDPSGNPQTNVALSQQRAEKVIQRLAATGLDTSKFVAKGFGDQKPSNLNGPQGKAYYDRRVEFSIVELNQPASFSGTRNTPLISSCAAQLAAAVEQTKLYYAPGAVTVGGGEMDSVYRLAQQASACPDARLRVVGQYSGQPGSGENPSTGRLRAAVVMSKMVGAGIDAQQIIIAGHSRPGAIPGQPGVSDRRVDFDVILD